MARPPKNQPVDLSTPVTITAGVIERLTCPPGKDQAFLRDALAPGLRVRVLSHGAKTFVFERKVGSKTIRRTIGDVRNVTIEKARDTARTAYVDVGNGIDPWAEKKAWVEAHHAGVEKTATTVGQAWTAYCADRKTEWGDRHRADHDKMAGVVAQIMGHKPSATAEKHYTVRPLDLLRLHHEKIESWVLEQGGVQFVHQDNSRRLKIA